LGVCQYESFHPELESQPGHRWNPDSQQALVWSAQLHRQIRTGGDDEYHKAP
jgi:hypothetical protein